MRLSFYYAVVLLAALSLLLPPVRATCPFPDTFSQHTKLLDSGSPGQASYFWCNYTGRTHYLCYGQNVTINPKDNAIYGTSGSVGPNLPFESLYDRKFEFNPRKENSPACPIKRESVLCLCGLYMQGTTSYGSRKDRWTFGTPSKALIRYWQPSCPCG
eukprot:g35583.t1